MSDLSHKFYFENMAISLLLFYMSLHVLISFFSFVLGPSCVQIFFQYPGTFMCAIFFNTFAYHKSLKPHIEKEITIL